MRRCLGSGETAFKLFLVLLVAVGCSAQQPRTDTIRGKLTEHMGKPAIQGADGKFVYLDGDEPTRGVIHDKRLAGSDFAAKGRFTSPDRFQIDPIHTSAIHVYKDGKPKLVTYWCEVCSIRTYTPGQCWCCQQETALDLRDPDPLPQ